jgi:DNA ligase D-like protein (predicted ligase)
MRAARPFPGRAGGDRPRIEQLAFTLHRVRSMPAAARPPRRLRSLPAHVQPMLCALVADAFDDPDWIFEPKLDGLRVIARFDGRQINLLSRNDKPQERAFPDIVNALRKAVSRPIILDGEIVCLDERGRSSFRALQQRFHLENQAVIAQRARDYPAYFYVFDILFLDGEDLRDRPLRERKQVLRKALRWNARVRWTEHVRRKGIETLRRACREGREGVVAKRLDSPYVSARSGAWLKIKCSGRQEFAIGGFTDPQRSRIGLGALLVGYYSDDGKSFIYAGKVGTGFTNQMLTDLRRRLEKMEVNSSPFTRGEPPTGEHVHWVKPKLLAEIAFAEWTRHALLRQPRFEGLREDKPASAARRERPRLLPESVHARRRP